MRGKQLGRKLGTPTLNQIPREEKLLPPDGVYASRVYLDDKMYGGMTNIGMRPTMEDVKVRNVETCLFDFDKNIYGRNVKVELLAFQLHLRLDDAHDAVHHLPQGDLVHIQRHMAKTKQILGKINIDNKK